MNENKITLSNFEQQLNTTIVKRGRQYFEEKRVMSLHESKPNDWELTIVGTDDYNVSISLGRGNAITYAFCDCPYDDTFCKHVVAGLFALHQAKQNAVKPPKKGESKKSFDKLLSKVKLKDFQEFIKNYAAKNKLFKTEFELYFAEKDPSIDVELQYRKLIEQTTKPTYKWGYINNASQLAKAYKKYVGEATDFFNKNNYRDAFTLCTLLFSRISSQVSETHSVNESISASLWQILDLIEAIAQSSVSFDFKEKIYSFLQKEVGNEYHYQNGDYDEKLLEIYELLSINLQKTREYIDFLDTKINIRKDYDYFKRFYLQKKIAFLSKIGKSSEIDAIIEENLEISEFRIQKVEQYIAQKDYESAKKLVLDGIAIAQKKDHSGFVSQWEKMLLKIAYATDDTPLQIALNRKFALEEAKIRSNYYLKWKSYYSAEEWKQIIDNEIENIKKETTKSAKKLYYPAEYYLARTLGFILINENYFDSLLDLLKKSFYRDVFAFFTHFPAEYHEKITEILIPMLEKQGDEASERSHYKHLAREMTFIMQKMPSERAKIVAIAQKLREKYPRRKAMLEEFREMVR